MQVLLGGMSAATLLIGLGAYLFLLRRAPDALRSEGFTLRKMALEKGLIGDNLAGLFEPTADLGAGSVQSAKLPAGGKQRE
jgi:hypothetical protein